MKIKLLKSKSKLRLNLVFIAGIILLILIVGKSSTRIDAQSTLTVRFGISTKTSKSDSVVNPEVYNNTDRLLDSIRLLTNKIDSTNNISKNKLDVLRFQQKNLTNQLQKIDTLITSMIICKKQ